MINRTYTIEYIKEVDCVACQEKYKVKINETITVINEYKNRYQEIKNIICPACGMIWLGDLDSIKEEY